MLPDEMEAEKNRKILLQQAEQIEMLKRQLAEETAARYAAYKRIAELTSNEWTPTEETQERYHEFIKRMYNETCKQ